MGAKVEEATAILHAMADHAVSDHPTVVDTMRRPVDVCRRRPIVVLVPIAVLVAAARGMADSTVVVATVAEVAAAGAGTVAEDLAPAAAVDTAVAARVAGPAGVDTAAAGTATVAEAAPAVVDIREADRAPAVGDAPAIGNRFNCMLEDGRPRPSHLIGTSLELFIFKFKVAPIRLLQPSRVTETHMGTSHTFSDHRI